MATRERAVERRAARRARAAGARDAVRRLPRSRYAYRFGPPAHDLVVATLRAPSGETLAQAFHFPLGLPATRELDVGLDRRRRASTATATRRSSLRTRRFAQSIAVEADGFEPDDAYFHLAPGDERALRLRRTGVT